MIDSLITLFLHIDQNMVAVIQEYGIWTYFILFFIIFFETGFVIFPFLPGDSLLFVSGAAAAGGMLDIKLLLIAIILGAVIGDTVNYWIGRKIGPRAFKKEDARVLKKKYLDETHDFYEKYGKATIILARFVPIVRTFAPFVAGIGDMNYPTFLAYNVIGGVAWVTLFLGAGYFFGGISVVKHNFTLVIVAIVIISVLPMAIKAWSNRRKSKAAAAIAAKTEEAGPDA